MDGAEAVVLALTGVDDGEAYGADHDCHCACATGFAEARATSAEAAAIRAAECILVFQRATKLIDCHLNLPTDLPRFRLKQAVHLYTDLPAEFHRVAARGWR
jgi:hypothetical protein